ncbi:DUF1580 domain-containing protein [Crateriforma conspicua]|uniref:DUF1580 domain-containing protein n=1 Tax=Crateriforma conspicua TaxID=2527996 RepID=UPI00118CFAC3|nr:DUF1580 domain-containing protein [Crateriforma conspicua]QDV64617.1 hypothetical protein Mal65_37770 [Crateriforma conspicua]
MQTAEQDAGQSVRRILSEDILTIAEARAEIARVTGRRCRPDKATMTRWIQRGVGDTKVKLEAIRLGRQWFTSRQSITRFIEARSR